MGFHEHSDAPLILFVSDILGSTLGLSVPSLFAEGDLGVSHFAALTSGTRVGPPAGFLVASRFARRRAARKGSRSEPTLEEV